MSTNHRPEPKFIVEERLWDANPRVAAMLVMFNKVCGPFTQYQIDQLPPDLRRYFTLVEDR